jgi:uncharacterized protein
MDEAKTGTDGTLIIGTGVAHPGEIVRCGIPTGRDIYGNNTSIPLVVINGSGSGPVLWLNGATHGDEAEGAISMVKLLELINPADLNGAIVACPAMNPEAFETASRGNMMDTKAYDMNRIYPGDAEGQITERVAAAHFNAMKMCCDLQINIHSGGTGMYIGEVLFVADTPTSLELAAAMGPSCSLIVKIGVDEGNPASQMAAAGGAGIGIELGGLSRSLTQDAHVIGDKLCGYFLNVLRHYGMIEGETEHAEQWLLGHLKPISSPGTGLWLGERDLQFLVPLPAGSRIGKLYSLHCDMLAEVVTPCDGIVAGLRAQPQTIEGEPLAFFVVIDEEVDDLLPGIE